MMISNLAYWVCIIASVLVFINWVCEITNTVKEELEENKTNDE